MVFLTVLVLTLATAGLYAFLAPAVTVWRVLAAAALAFLAWNLVFLLLVILHTLTLKKLRDGEGIEKQNPVSRWICAEGGRWLCDLGGVSVHLGGLEKLPEGPFLYVCNHRSLFDPLIAMGWLKRYNISFVSKPSNLKIPFVGNMARHAGFLAIDRENNREALKTILQAADYLKRGLCSVGIFPEGTRTKTGELLPFHAGSFKIAQKAGVPVAVACIRGSERVKRCYLFWRTPVYLEVLEVIDAERVKSMPTVELAEYARDLIRKKIEES